MRNARLFAAVVLLCTAACGEEEEAAATDVAADIADSANGEQDVPAVDTAVPDTAAPEDEGEPLAGAFGAPCGGNEDCESEWCVPGEQGLVCTRTCLSDCPQDWSCVGVSGGGADLVFLCLPRQTRQCAACVSDVQCGSGVCATFNDSTRGCTRFCDDATPCGDGFTCSAQPGVGDSAAPKVCVPNSGTCTCSILNAGEQRACSKANDFGTCQGAETCDGEAGWLACSAREASAETCNYLDDDCDGAIDEDAKVDGVYNSLAHCGGCNLPCAVANGEPICRVTDGAPRCEAASCNTGFFAAGPAVCLPLSSSLCLPCVTDANCAVPGDRCLESASGRFCGRDCGDDSVHGTECPEGFVCEAQSDESKQCVPANHDCTCTAGQAGSVRSCAATSELGTCYGTETCDPATGWGGCDAQPPAAELCNGADDDCDGLVDELAEPPAETCTVDNSDGSCPGAWVCAGGSGWSCSGQTPAAETCNGLDDDCDGNTDEDFRNEAGLYDGEENCGLCGFACDNTIAFATGETCHVVGNKARCVPTGCLPGYFTPPEAPHLCVPQGGGFACSPCGEDAHCQGLQGGRCITGTGAPFCAAACTADAECPGGFTCQAQPDGPGGVPAPSACVPLSGDCSCLEVDAGKTRACVRTSPYGACLGTETCAPATGWSGCTAGTPAAEVCNGKDDDCDGIIDDGVLPAAPSCAVTNAEGTCSAAPYCAGAAGWQCPAKTPAVESCNAADDDCDGITDEGFSTNGLYASVTNCGACGNSCVGQFAHGTADCAVLGGAPRCVVGACDAGYYKVGDFACLPLDDRLCLPCASDAACGAPGDRCIAGPSGAFCAQSCAPDSPHGTTCPTGYGCAEAEGSLQCLPLTGDCTCTADSLGGVRACVEKNSFGTCVGTESCKADGWGSCSVAPATPEVCNGKDDDCDGIVDAGAEAPAAVCAKTTPAGTCTGSWLCGGAAGWTCVAKVPQAEACNGQDDDCDGFVDEDFKQGTQLVHPNHCGICGFSCSGAVDFASATDCALVDEVPRCVATVCQAGYQLLPDFGGICIPLGGATVCSPCANDSHCAGLTGGACTVVDGAKRCTSSCTESAECPEGTACTEGRCQPTSGSCSCLPDDVGTIRTCLSVNSAGACFGTETCAPSGWSECTAAEPVAELCNGLDDDCDGQIDEELVPPGPTCEVSNEAGTCKAAWSCAGSGGWVCPAATPALEICNGKDDDCDGVVDDPFRSASGAYATLENCGACGVGCPGAIAHATERCDESSGAPRCVVDTCDAGYFQAGPLTCLTDSLGLCNPCVSDAECLGSAAKCVPLDGASFCANPCDSVGGCPGGYACGDDHLCRPVTGSCTCNGSDSGFQRACKVPSATGVGQCGGLQLCTGAGWGPCVLPPETCNLLDDDCDGETDEDFLGPSGVYADDRACGACGNDCTLLTFAGGAGSCNTFVSPPVCSLTCSDNCFDLNANPSDGCECCDPTPEDQPDPAAVDANCDGIDGEVNNAIFVAKAGDDAAPGTREAPKRTIQAGIQAALAANKRDVYVSTGVYAEAVLLRGRVAVYGGYSADYARRNAVKYETAILPPDPTLARPGAVSAIGVTEPATLDGFTIFGAIVKGVGKSSYAVYLRDSDASVRIQNCFIVGGAGGKGGRGTDGVDGADGAPGSPGVAALDLYTTYGVQEHNCSAANHSPGGAGGVQVCGGLDVAGGGGGLRACPTYDGVTTRLPLAVEAGVDGKGGGGLGGAAGRDVFHQAFQCLGFATFGPVEGLAGGDGPPGVEGKSGPGCMDDGGSVADGFWVPGLAGNGGSGGHGRGGGGGGSGGGAYTHTSCFAKDFGYDNLGGTGGGGGSGACAGTGGGGALGGGAAFGVFVVFTAPTASFPQLIGNLLVGGTGGDAGAGGNAGVGGAGGGGALGGAAGGDFEPPDPTYPAYEGGKGGNGGNGGNGGGGGGGCGGPAYGIYLGSAAGPEAQAWKANNVFLDLGTGGEGGPGGYSLTSPGGAGSPGVAMPTNF